ncbi:hypothetical protein HDZ31DRAFT_39799 [Schizophyllum fasciatum]
MAERDMEQLRWERLVTWLRNRGMRTDGLKVERRPRDDGGYGLFARDACAPGEILFTIPAGVMLSVKTLQPLYPPPARKLSAVQLVSLHLCRHRPPDGAESTDPVFGPYISALPRDFGFHPLTWLVEPAHPGNALLKHIPPAPKRELEDLEKRFSSDWAACQKHLNDTSRTESDFLWAWLNVNTRCMHYRVKPSASDPDNLALCPVMDFANHRPAVPHMNPRPTKEFPARADMSFVASDEPILAGEELYFCYGPHSNRTLFVEYGFAIREATGEVDVEDLLEAEIQRGRDGEQLRQLLEDEGYWGDWTLHSHPEPHISFRLLAALRLLSSVNQRGVERTTIDPNAIVAWRDTLLGTRERLSKDVEEGCKEILLELCRLVSARATNALADLQQLNWKWSSFTLETANVLWEEERTVANGLMQYHHALW